MDASRGFVGQRTQKPGGTDKLASTGKYTLAVDLGALTLPGPRRPATAARPVKRQASPGRPGTRGGQGVSWVPHPPPTGAALEKAQAAAAKASDELAKGFSPFRRPENFPEWLRNRPDFAMHFMGADDGGGPPVPSPPRSGSPHRQGQGHGSSGHGGGGHVSPDKTPTFLRPSAAELAARQEAEVIRACSKSKATRSAADLLSITRHLREQAFTLGMDAMTLERISACCQYEGARAGEVVVRQGERGDVFYMILRGTLDVEVKNLGVVAQLTGGNSFGELALTTCEARQATVRATSDVTMIRLHRDDFQEIMAARQSRWVDQVVEFIGSLPLFNKWSTIRLRRLATVLSIQNCKEGEEVVAQGKPADRLYFVRLGELQMIHHSEVCGENKWPAPPGGYGHFLDFSGTDGSAGGDGSGTGSDGRPLSPLAADMHLARSGDGSTLGSVSAEIARAHHRRMRAPPTTIDGSGRHPMGIRRTKLTVSEPVGEVKPGAMYGLAQVAKNEPHPFSLMAKTSCQLLYLHAKYLRPNKVCGYDILDKMKRDKAGMSEGNPLLALFQDDGGNNANGGRNSVREEAARPGSSATQILLRTGEHNPLKDKLQQPGPVKGGKRLYGEEELGAPHLSSSMSAKRTGRPLSRAATNNLLQETVAVHDAAGPTDEDFNVNALLQALSGTGVVIYPSAARYLKDIGMATKHGMLAKRLLNMRRNSLSTLIPLETSDCELILRRMMTRLDEDNRALRDAAKQEEVQRSRGEGGQPEGLTVQVPHESEGEQYELHMQAADAEEGEHEAHEEDEEEEHGEQQEAAAAAQ